MMRQIPLFKIATDRKDIESAARVIEKGMNWASGAEVPRFERLLSGYLGVKYCVTFNSGTSALYAALSAGGIGPGDEVIVPSFSYIAVSCSPLLTGAKAVFADVEEETFGLDPSEIVQRKTDRTRAVLAVHYGGSPCQIGEIRKIAAKHRLFLVEDAAEAFGAGTGGRKLGSFGDCGILSFCQGKIISTGEGGCVVTNRRMLYERLRAVRSLKEEDKRRRLLLHDYPGMGFNLRMSNIAAALGVSQFGKTRRNIVERRRVAKCYVSGLSKIAGVELPKPLFHPCNVYQMFPVLVNENVRDRLMEFLRRKGIMTKSYFYPAHKSPFFRARLKSITACLPVTERLARRVLCLPVYPGLEKREMDRVAGAFREFFSRF